MTAPCRWILAVVMLVALAGTEAVHAQRGGKVPPVDERVYLTPPAALRQVLGEGVTIERCRLKLTEAESQAVAERLGRRLWEGIFEVFRALDEDGKPTGYAVITEEIGKFQPITFVVAVTPAAKVQEVAVMVYRESHGGEVKRRRFLRQYIGKTTRDRIRINRDIINISGATLSARSLSRGTRKVLHLVDHLVLGSTRRQEIDWQVVNLDGDADDAGDAGEKTSAPDSGDGTSGKGSDSGAGAADENPDADAEDRQSGLRRALRYRMGSTLEIVTCGEAAHEDAAVDAAFAEVARLDALLSTYLPTSEISAVNSAPTGQWTAVSPDTARCLAAALAVARDSDGAYDPTLVDHGHSGVDLDEDGARVRLTRPGLRLDLGGIGKGYALDRAAEVLRARGVEQGLLNFGGQILALAPPPGEQAWIVGVRDPSVEDRVLGYYAVASGSVSTSARYERGDHIVDPRTGLPADAAATGAASVTVCHPSATTADALSTALAVRGAAGLPRLRETLTARGAALVVAPDAALTYRHRGSDGPRFVAVVDSGTRTQ